MIQYRSQGEAEEAAAHPQIFLRKFKNCIFKSEIIDFIIIKNVTNHDLVGRYLRYNYKFEKP